MNVPGTEERLLCACLCVELWGRQREMPPAWLSPSAGGQTGEQGPNPAWALRDEEEFAWEALSLLIRRETKVRIHSAFNKYRQTAMCP